MPGIRSTGYACRKNGSSFFSQAFLYGVNTENGVPPWVSTSSFSNMT